MNTLVQRFLENNGSYDSDFDHLLELEMKKKHDKKDFSSILAIIGNKYIEEKNFAGGQLLSSVLLKLSQKDSIILTKDHIKIMEYFENVSEKEYRKFKIRMLIISISLSFLMFLIFYFIGKLKIEVAGTIAISLFIVDNYLLKKNKKEMYQKSLNMKIAKNDFSKLEQYIKINTFK